MEEIGNSSEKDNDRNTNQRVPCQIENHRNQNKRTDSSTTVIDDMEDVKETEKKIKQRRKLLRDAALEVQKQMKTDRLKKLNKLHGIDSQQIFQRGDKKKSRSRSKSKSNNDQRRRKSMEARLGAVMNASQKLSNIRYDTNGEKVNVVLGLDPKNLRLYHENELFRQSSNTLEGTDELVSNHKNARSEETYDQMLKMSQELTLEQTKSKKNEMNNEDDLDDDGIFNWPQAKLTTDKSIDKLEEEQRLFDEGSGSYDDDDYFPIHEFFAENDISLSSVSLSAIFQLLEDDEESEKSEKTLLAVFADDARFSKQDGLILFQGANNIAAQILDEDDEDPYIKAFKEAGGVSAQEEDEKEQGVMSWVGGGINIVKNNLTAMGSSGDLAGLDHTRHGLISQKSEPKSKIIPKYPDYVGGPPPEVFQSGGASISGEAVFDARPPPVDEIEFDVDLGEVPDFVLKQERGRKHEPSIGMSNLRRLRKMRRRRDISF